MIRTILSICAKELRALFQSQIALLFLGLFILSTHLSFFVLSKFFSRNLADVTPLLASLPLQLILLVAAVSMRAWAEERKSGTLEVLLTLPVKTWSLVLGKFAAGMGLVATALLMTVSIPVTVWLLGPLDWGPVIGGYTGALLLASSYLAIGLCVSARTDNQVLALMGTMAVGGLLYAIGLPQIHDVLSLVVDTSLGWLVGLIPALESALGAGFEFRFPNLGTGSRFESIARGVLDLRDILYYASITVFFLTLNAYFLDSQRIDSSSGSGRLMAMRGLVGLVLLNAVAANLWVGPLRSARVDLTQNGDYTLSKVTKSLLAELEEPLVIEGIFSKRSHPKLEPLAPQLQALLEEYENYGANNTTVEFIDPGVDEDLAQRLEQDYGVRAVPMPVRDRNEQRVVNAWFHVLLKYGDQHQVVDFSDLVEVEIAEDGVDVRLRDPEYDVTKAIRKVTADFVSTASLVSKLPPGSSIKVFASPDGLDEQGMANLELLREIGNETADLGPNLHFEESNPLEDPALAEQVLNDYGVQPVLSLATGQRFYLYMVIHIGDTAQRIFPREELKRADLQRTIDSALARSVPGQRKRVAILTETPQAPPPNPSMPPQPPPQPDYQTIRRVLADRFEVEAELDLTNGTVPDSLDVLIIGKPGFLSPMQKVAIDQFLLRGGNVIALAGARAEPGRDGFRATPENKALNELLAGYGVTVEEGQVLDAQNSTLTLPIGRQLAQFDYAYFPDVRPETMNTEHLAMANLLNLSVPWASPLTVEVPEGLTSEVLVQTSERSWVRNEPLMMPDFRVYPELGFEVPTELSPQTVAVAVRGRFPSAFTEENRPRIDSPLTTSVGEGKLVVIGSSEIVSDMILGFAGSPSGKYHRNNPILLNNVIDWVLEDTDLLEIRNSGAFARTLVWSDPDALFLIEVANYVFGLLPLPFLYVLSRRRRRLPELKEVAA